MGDLMGVADIVFLDDTLYAVLAGGGCSHGNPTSPNGVVKVDTATGKWSLVAELGAFLKAHQTRYESADDCEPDGTFYGAIAHDGSVYTVEPNHGEVPSVSKRGQITR